MQTCRRADGRVRCAGTVAFPCLLLSSCLPLGLLVDQGGSKAVQEKFSTASRTSLPVQTRKYQNGCHDWVWLRDQRGQALERAGEASVTLRERDRGWTEARNAGKRAGLAVG